MLDLGFERVETYIQSGNVIFGTDEADDDSVAGLIEDAIARDHGLTVSVIVRAVDDLRAATASNPFTRDEDDHAKLLVVFLADEAAPAAVAELEPERFVPDRFAVIGREIFCHYPSGSGRSKMTIDYFERILDSRATARNMRTLSKLVDRIDAAS